MKKPMSPEEVLHLNERIKKEFRIPEYISPGSMVSLVDGTIILVDNRPLWFYHQKQLVPTLHVLLTYNFLPKVIVHDDFRYLIQRGEDIVGNRVVSCDDFKKHDLVAIIDTKLNKPIAVGKALFDAKGIKDREEVVIQNIHHEKDRMWEMTWFI